MNERECKQALKLLTGSFPRPPMSPEELVVWTDTLLPLDFLATRTAIRLLRDGQDFRPTHRELRVAALAEARRLDELSAGEVPPRCALCDGTGWRSAETEGDVDNAVVRCKCRPEPVADEHPARCSCMRCHYGPRRAARIRSGRDGMTDREGADPLKVRAPTGEPPAEMF